LLLVAAKHYADFYDKKRKLMVAANGWWSWTNIKQKERKYIDRKSNAETTIKKWKRNRNWPLTFKSMWAMLLDFSDSYSLLGCSCLCGKPLPTMAGDGGEEDEISLT
jgi:hypothetical protein